MKQKIIQAIKSAGGTAFPKVGENDYKARLDRLEAILECQMGIALEEIPAEKEKKVNKKKAGFTKLPVLLALLTVGLALTVFGADAWRVNQGQTTNVAMSVSTAGDVVVASNLTAYGEIVLSGTRASSEGNGISRQAKVSFGSGDWGITTSSVLSVDIPTNAVIKNGYLIVGTGFGVASNDATALITLGNNTLVDLLAATSLADTGSLATADAIVQLVPDYATVGDWIVDNSAYSGISYTIAGADVTSGTFTIYIDYDL